MAQYAHLGHPKGKIVAASTVSKTQSERYHFYCATPGCNAEMVVVNAGEGDNAFFRSRNIQDHKSYLCIKEGLVFDRDSYDEDLFSVQEAFKAIMSGAASDGRSGKIRTVPTFYSMCLSLGKDGRYNGFKIDDLLADQDNKERYSKGIIGLKLVETATYHKIKDELAFRMNYPAMNKGLDSWVKVYFKDKKLFWNLYNRLMGARHADPIIIAGDWFPSEEDGYHSQCEIVSEQQLFFLR